jgi:cobalt-zinc-cadmium efflux system outer membrane protein
MLRSRIAVRAALTAALVTTVFAAREGGLTLDQAVELALARNPEVLAARTAIDAARGRTLQLGSRPEPQVQAGLEGVPIPGLGRAGDEVEVRLGIEQIFEFPGKRPLRAAIGRTGEDLAAAELERVRLLVAAKVKRVYWRAVFAQSAASALDKSAGRFDVLLADLQAKYRAGTAGYADVLRARAEKARLRNQALEQDKDRRSAALELNELLALPADDAVELLTGLAFTPLGAAPAASWDAVRPSRPSFRIASLRMERAEAAVKLAGLGRNPDFLAGFLLPSVRPNAWGVSFGLTMPFLRPARARGEAMEARAEAEAARLSAEALDRRAQTAVETAYAAAKSAEAQVLVFEQSLLRELEDELGIQLEYFRYGKADATALLDLHRTFVLAEVEHLRALLLYHLAVADLNVAGEELK